MENYNKKPMYIFLLVLTIASTAGLHIWRVLFDNFSINVVHLEGNHVGIIQSVREIPGFLALLVVYFLLIIREHKLSALSIIIFGLGLVLTGFFPTFYGLIFTTLLMSFGFHYFETTNQSLTLQYFDRATAPIVFGKLRSYASVTNICAGAAIYFTAEFMHAKEIYLYSGIFVIICALWAFFQNPVDINLTPQRKNMVFKWKYWLFYSLTFMAGARRQIFVAFAVFLLVKRFGYTIQDIAVLFFLNNLVDSVSNPYIGKAIVRFGERKILSLEYSSLILIFLAYAFVDSKIVVAFLYIADNFVYNFAIAIKTHFQKIAEPEDIAPSMAVGFTINHIAAVVLPAIGGMLWMIDYRIPFLGAAFLSLCSLILVQFIRTEYNN